MNGIVVTDIVLTHRFASPPGWVSDEYALARKHHGIVYALDGHAQYTMGDGSGFRLEKGDCLYIPKGAVYTTRCDQDTPFVHMTVNFDLYGDQALFTGITRRRVGTTGRLEQVFGNLVNHWTVRHANYREYCMGQLYEMLYLVLSEPTAPRRQYEKKVLRAREYLDAHFCEEFPLECLPEFCGLSPTYFRRLFQRAYQETPANYRRRLRIARATDLLLSGQYSVEEVAGMCGYPDPAYFSRTFKKIMGVNPSSYRER